MQALDASFIKRPNIVCARHILLTSKQAAEENISSLVARPKQFTEDCEFNAATTEQNRNEMLLKTIKIGLKSDSIRQQIPKTVDA